ncbi:MAG: hypothetical protein KGQ51_04150 [Planctomycetes bacterium]|nr:hypothetical protein [Planctomycetota bacterium]
MKLDESQLQLLIQMGVIQKADKDRAKQILEAFQRLKDLRFGRSCQSEWIAPRSAFVDGLHREIDENNAHIAEIKSLLEGLSILRNDANGGLFDQIEHELMELRTWNERIEHYLQQVTSGPSNSSVSEIQSRITAAMKELKESVESKVAQ